MSILKKISLLSLTLLTAHGVNALVTFSSGQTARAIDFNNNFNELNENIGATGRGGGTPFVDAKVNGVDMRVRMNESGDMGYVVITPKGTSVAVGVDGRLLYGGEQLYYTSSDCSGQPYLAFEFTPSKEVNESYAVPLLPGLLGLGERNDTLYYSTFKTIVKLNVRSSWETYSSDSCYSREETIIASLAVENDVAETGLATYPLVITGVGDVLTVSAEVGVAGSANLSVSRDVLANGVKIGVTKRVYKSIRGVQVELDAYPGQVISLNKDGSYTGFGITSPNEIYFTTNDCTGNAYTVSDSYIDSNSWNFSVNKGAETVLNNGQYYSVDTTALYKAAFSSRKLKSGGGSCTAGSSGSSDRVYFKLAPIGTPSVPAPFTPPITIDGLADIIVNDLPAAN